VNKIKGDIGGDMYISKWNPLHEMNRFFDDVIENLPAKYGFDLAVDLYEDGDNLVAEMSAPGIDIKNTEVNVVDNVLRISGQREEKRERKEKNYFSREIHHGSFSRTIRLPSPVVSEQTKASYKDGVLKIVMPMKKASEQKNKIEIQSE